MDLSQARYIADGVIAHLKPSSERIMIVGGIRRHKSDVHDIDICVIPRKDKLTDMFGQDAGEEVCAEFIQAVNCWTKIKGEPTGKYTQRLLPQMIKLEISICDRATWPTITLIRTGDAEFTHMLMKRALKLGFNQKDGLLWDGDKAVHLLDETDYFRVLNLPFIIPEKRDKNAFK